MLQTDWGGEYQALSGFLKECGIKHRTSCPYTPQQNGLAERKHRHIVEMGLSLLAESGLPPRFWDDAFLTSVFLINILPSKTIKNLSPHEKLFRSKPDYTSFKTFGCLCYPHTRPYNKNKLEYRSVAATFLGYSSSHKGYKVLLPQGKVIVTRDIIFDETVFPFKAKHSPNPPNTPNVASPPPPPVNYLPLFLPPQPPAQLLSQPPLHAPTPVQIPHTHTSFSSSATPPSNLDNEHSDQNEQPIPSPAPITESGSNTNSNPDGSSSLASDTDTTIALAPSHHMITRSKAGIFKPKAFTLSITPVLIPRSALEAILIPMWKVAMLEEFLVLLRNKTWILTTLPPE